MNRAFAVVCLLLGACAGSTSPPASLPSAAESQAIDELILVLADRKIYDAFTVEEALAAGPETRRRLADALGRAGRRDGLLPLQQLLVDPDLEVRGRAAFALGQLGEASSSAALRVVAVDDERDLAVLAVEALAKLGEPLDKLHRLLAAVGNDELWPRLAPSLYRFEPEEILPLAVRGVGSRDPAVRRALVFALTREPVAEAMPILRSLMSDEDVVARAWIARATGIVGDASDVPALLARLDDESGPSIQALRALRRLVQEEHTEPDGGWLPPLLERMAHPQPGVRAVAVEVSGDWPASGELDTALQRFATEGSTREQELALMALAERSAEGVDRLVERATASPEPRLRVAAAVAASRRGRADLVERLAFDPDPGVRMAVHQELLAGDPDEAASAAVWILEDSDAAVRAAVLEWLSEQPRLSVELLARALDGYSVSSPGELPVVLVAALSARAEAEPLEQGLGVRLLEALAGSERYVVRRAAVEALAGLGAAAPTPEPAVASRPLDFYSSVREASRGERWLDVETRHGTLRLGLDCPSAPLTCTSIVQLAEQGFFDGLAFHRVVPDFVVQAGDPRGDGWGGPGYDIRDEINPQRYERGVVGMALSGPDTGGSQFFITLSPQPHLDGRYTAFGRVISGDEVLDRIEQGDRILEIREVVP